MYIVGIESCPWCNRAKQLLNNNNKKYQYLVINNEFRNYMNDTYNHTTVPMVFKNNGKFIGGYESLENYINSRH